MKKIVLVLLIFIMLAIYATFPLGFHMNTYIPAAFDTSEPFSILQGFWWVKFSSLHGLDFRSRNFIAAPFGVPFTRGQADYPLWDAVNKFFIMHFNEVFAYNINIILSFLLAGIFAYLLVFYLTKSWVCALFSGAIYALCPYHFARAWQHLGLSHIEFFPLFILGLIRLRDDPRLKNILLVSLSLFLIFCFDFYYAYFALIIAAVFILFLLFNRLKKKVERVFTTLRALTIAVIICILLLLPVILPIVKDMLKPPETKVFTAYTLFHRPFEDLFQQSAKPLSYFLPATAHPVFGTFTERFAGSFLYGESITEHTLYLGWVALFLAFLAFRCRKKGEGKEGFYISFFVFLAIAAWLFSQPPWWNTGFFKIYPPSFFMYKILPMFRAYCRFGVVVMLAVAVLAGFGLKCFLERFKTKRPRVLFSLFMFGLALFDFSNWPPYKVVDVSGVPAVYAWVKKEPGDFTIAEYPLDADTPYEMYMFYQTRHEKKMINCTIPDTPPNKIARTITKLSAPQSAGVLKWLGVKYALVHRDRYLEAGEIEVQKELEKIAENPGLKLIRSFPAETCPGEDISCLRQTGVVDVYEVVAKPVRPKEEAQ
ncbi:MAG: YfhO family protein [Candidatus Omnitrophica bacterium]|nr:YfhO family protein [Candidatus Omnitrophota bacterium]